MAFTSATIVHTFQNADGTPASGKVTFDLTARMTNAGTTVLPSDLTAPLDSSGSISAAVIANDDAGTSPTDARWRVTLRILGADEEQFYITVPAGGGTVDLGTLLPATEQVD